MFSIGGQIYNGRTLSYSYMPDLVLENARNVSIHLLHRIARFVKLRLFFADRWIMLSEVYFDSGKLFIQTRETASENTNRFIRFTYSPEVKMKAKVNK